MQMTVTNTEKAAIISAAGRMDAVTAPQFDKRLETLVAEGATRIIIDFRDLEYISSAALPYPTPQRLLNVICVLKPAMSREQGLEIRG